MQIKTFRAANLQAALEEIREQLGPHASVLKTRQCRDGWMGWLGRSYVEVTASASDGNRTADWNSQLEDNTSHSPQITLQRIGVSMGESDSNRLIDSRMVSSARQFGVEDRFCERESELMTLGVDLATAQRWIRSTRGFEANLDQDSRTAWREQLYRTVARELRIAGPTEIHPGERRIVALIGPTGVGKTTTVAKLAAGFRNQSKRRVGLLTIDTFRIAAVQQLQAYAQIMDLPMVVVESSQQMRGAIEQLGDVDLILIDTAGRSPRGDMQVDNLAELLRVAQPDETHLVISATSSPEVVHSAVNGFSVARPTATILTKLDEAPYTAGVLAAISSPKLAMAAPISYLTNGQHVPEDISTATADRLVARLMPSPIEAPQVDAA